MSELLANACRNQRKGGVVDLLSLCRKLRKKKGLERDAIIHQLYLACVHDCLDTLKVLMNVFRLSHSDVRDAQLIRWACYYGHDRIIRFLHRRKCAVAADVIHQDGLLEAICKGHTSTVLLLHHLFGLTRADVQRIPHALAIACKRGYIDTVKVLHIAYGLGAPEARYDNCLALRVACEEGWNNVVTILHTMYGLKREDVHACYNSALTAACAGLHGDVVETLGQLYKVKLLRSTRAHNSTEHDIRRALCRSTEVVRIGWAQVDAYSRRNAKCEKRVYLLTDDKAAPLSSSSLTPLPEQKERTLHALRSLFSLNVQLD